MEDTLPRDWLTKEEAEAFIGKNSQFYLDKWKSNPDSALKGWNWAAMFFGIEWMAYRKMYIEAVLYFLTICAVSFASAFFLTMIGIDFYGNFIGDAFRLLAGILGNAMYRKKALRILNKTKSMAEPERIDYLKAKGGVSILGVIGCMALEVVWLFL